MSKIKKIEIHNLLNPDSPIKKWDINKSLYLYGPNGVGKTTLLDSLYAAIQNDLSIFEYHDSKTNESNSRKLLYNLSLTLRGPKNYLSPIFIGF